MRKYTKTHKNTLNIKFYRIKKTKDIKIMTSSINYLCTIFWSKISSVQFSGPYGVASKFYMCRPTYLLTFCLYIAQIDELGKQWRFNDDDEEEPEVKSDDVIVGSTTGVASCTAYERLQPDETKTPSSVATTNPPTTATTTTFTGLELSTSPSPERQSPTNITARHSSTDCVPPSYSSSGLDSLIEQLVTSVQRGDDVSKNTDGTCCNLVTKDGPVV